jgi:hypothetical protein
MSIIKKFRWIIAILLAIGEILYLNSAMFNFWVATGPPNACPECFLRVGYKHFGISIFSFILSILTLWFLRNKKSLK